MRDRLRLLLSRLVGLYEIARGLGSYDVQERNMALLYLDIVAASVLSAAANFNSAFALRLGASNALIGLMTSLPALITMLGMIPASAIVERQARRWPAMLRSLGITRILFFPIVLIPLLVPKQYQAVALVGLLTFRFLTVLVFSAGFDSVLADIVPPRLRAQVFSWRNILSTAAMILSLLLIRPWLAWAPFPLNYQVVYLVGGIAGLVSMWFLMRVEVPESRPRVVGEKKGKLSLGIIKQAASEHPQYVRFLINTLVGNAGAYLASPLYMIYYVRSLSASDGWIASLSLIANIAAMMGYIVGRRLLPRFGESLILRVTWPVTGLLPVLIGISGSLNLVLVVVFWYSVVTPALNLSHYNTLLEVCPQERRPTYISVYSALNNVLAFVLPMAGVALVGIIGASWALILSGAMWIAGGMLFSLMPVKVADVSRASV